MKPARTNRSRRVGLSVALIPALVLLSNAIICIALGQTGQEPRPASEAQAAKPDAQPRGPVSNPSRPAVLVELFTSEGCSSCPPADKVLADLAHSQPVQGAEVIALSEHVDYWNQLGWKDPFSSALFSQRQADYTRALKLNDFYTPQMIVDGRVEFVGSKLDIARDAIGKAAQSPKAEVSAALKAAPGNKISIAIRVARMPGITAGDAADVMLAVTEDDLHSDVSRGENSGHKLSHAAVTRKLIRIGAIKAGTFGGERPIDLDPAWKRDNLKVVVFVQERAHRGVLGAAEIKLAGGDS